MKWIKTVEELPKVGQEILFLTSDNRLFLGEIRIHQSTEGKELVFQTAPLEHRGKTIVHFHYAESVYSWCRVEVSKQAQPYNKEECEAIKIKAKQNSYR